MLSHGSVAILTVSFQKDHKCKNPNITLDWIVFNCEVGSKAKVVVVFCRVKCREDFHDDL